MNKSFLVGMFLAAILIIGLAWAVLDGPLEPASNKCNHARAEQNRKDIKLYCK